MKTMTGKLASSFEEAAALALHAAGIDGISEDNIAMFRSLAENPKAGVEAEKIINSAIRSRYGKNSALRAERWLVPVPGLHYDSRDIPQLIIEVNIYLVAAVVVETRHGSLWITLVETIGKPETLAIPMIFLHAVVEKNLGRFPIVARDSLWTTWEVPGTRPVRLPNHFISELNLAFEYQSVVAWLGEFGDQGRWVAPLMTGSLLGLTFQDSSHTMVISKQGFTTEELISALESMAYRPDEAREMVKNAAPRLRSDMTLEDAIRITLQMGKGED